MRVKERRKNKRRHEEVDCFRFFIAVCVYMCAWTEKKALEEEQEEERDVLRRRHHHHRKLTELDCVNSNIS